ncbi:hypothetical protein Mapa_007473 [Marchantia paleacea]|nr:hypothetical protein Mapa_007473 [Marchantia paleacea]
MRRFLESAPAVPLSTPNGTIGRNGQEALPPVHYHGNQTLNAVSFGFIATAVLFAMFLVMAIFERILRPHRAARASARDEERAESIPETSADSQKPDITSSSSYSNAVSVLMPGQDYPTYFARPIPIACSRECVVWPSHNGSSDESSGSSDSDSSEKEIVTDLERGQVEASNSASRPSEEVLQDGVVVVKEKGESSSPASPEKEYIQDVEKAEDETIAGPGRIESQRN